MGFRFRKSVKIAPGVRLNIGKKSTSISIGGKGARYTVSSTGRKTASVGIPGTGISYSQSQTTKPRVSSPAPVQTPVSYSPKTYLYCGTVVMVCSVLLFIMCLLLLFVMPPIGIIGIVTSVLLLYLGKGMRKKGKNPNSNA